MLPNLLVTFYEKLNKENPTKSEMEGHPNFVINETLIAVLIIIVLQAGFAPLHLAVLQMSLEMVAFLLRLEVDPNVRDHQGRTPIHLIIEGPFSEAAASSSNQCKDNVHIRLLPSPTTTTTTM